MQIDRQCAAASIEMVQHIRVGLARYKELSGAESDTAKQRDAVSLEIEQAEHEIELLQDRLKTLRARADELGGHPWHLKSCLDGLATTAANNTEIFFLLSDEVAAAGVPVGADPYRIIQTIQ